jgi:transcriptional regulator with XRE-family HTH domain
MKLAQKVRAKRELPPPAERRAIRISAGVSQEDIAKELGLSRAAISRWETDKRCPQDEHLLAYVKILRTLRSESIR